MSVKLFLDVGNKTGGDSRRSPVTGSQKKKKKKKTVAPNMFKGILHVFPDEVSLFQGVQIVERGRKIQFNQLPTDRRALLSERLEQAMMRSNSFVERDLLQQRGTYGKVGLRNNEKEELDEST